MTPGARLSAAITLLDEIFAGEPAERALTRWARASRFAGSKDRAAVRDWVYDGLRRKQSLAWIGGATAGRPILAAAAKEAGEDLGTLFTGRGFDPAPLTDKDLSRLTRSIDDAPGHVRLDVPEFLFEELTASLGEKPHPVLEAMRRRAPVDLRVNTLKSTMDAVMVVLARDGVQAEPCALVPGALRVTKNPRLVNASRAYSQGMVELQDISSQYAARFAGARPGMRVLDYCAGGGGKALALAGYMEGRSELFAWDANPRRMGDIPARARRAGAEITVLSRGERIGLGASCDIVFVDAPCSGTGAWRRNPDAKWRLTGEKIEAFPPLQDSILAEASGHVKPGGLLVYATCSFLRRENEDRIDAFLRQNPNWLLGSTRRLDPIEGGDGFFMARLVAPQAN